jgi:hypothetical protein
MATKRTTQGTGPRKKKKTTINSGSHVRSSIGKKNVNKAFLQDKANMFNKAFLQDAADDPDADGSEVDSDAADDPDADSDVDSRALVTQDTEPDAPEYTKFLLAQVTEMLEANKADTKQLLELVLKNQKQQSKVNQRSTVLHDAIAHKIVTLSDNAKPKTITGVKKQRGRRKAQEACNAFAKATKRLADTKVFVLKLKSNWKCADPQVHTHTPTYLYGSTYYTCLIHICINY